jgi:NAD(P)-dependent dehydrogenase (short-subunit alcohol dehydrogenase family)
LETVLITGANRGIGLELVKILLREGRKVIATCRSPETAVDLWGLVSDMGTDATPDATPDATLDIQQLEVTDSTSIDALRAKLSGVQIDVLINNAGVKGSEHQSLKHMDVDAWRHTFEVNTIAPFQVSMALLENLKLSSRPRIITVSSQMGALSRAGSGVYAYRSTKAAVNKVMQLMAKDLDSEGIIVCPIHPGWVQTDMGGASADITVNESASGIVALMDSLTKEQSGRFWNWNGEEHPW